MRFFVANRTGTTVHVRLDDQDATGTFPLTLSGKKVTGGRPLTQYVLATATPLHVTWLDGEAEYRIVDKLGLLYEEYMDREGDWILRIDGYVQ